MTEILSVFGQQVTKIVPGSVGAYFRGCFFNTNVPGLNPACGLDCISGIKPNTDTPGFSQCQDLVVKIGDDQKLEYKNSDEIVSYSNAIIYIVQNGSDKKKKLTVDHLDELQRLGVSQAKIVIGNGDGYSQIADYTSIESLRTTIDSGVMDDDSDNDSSSDSKGWGWILLIILIIIIIIFLVIVFSNGGSGGSGWY